MKRALVAATLAAACGKGSGSEVLGNLQDPRELVVDESGVYVADGDQLVRWADGKRTSVFEGMRVGNIAVDPEAIYFVVDDQAKHQAELRRIPKQGGAVTVLATDWPLQDIQVDGKYVYWQSGELRRIAKSGGTRETIVRADSVDLSSDLAFDDRYVYFVGKDSVDRVPKDGGQVEVLATEARAAARPTIHDDVVWWTEDDWKHLKRLKLGGSVETIALDPGAFIAGLAWSNGMLVLDSTNKKLLRVDAAGKATTVRTFETSPSKLAVFGDATYVSFDKVAGTPAQVRRF
jgi:hypothetical protein